VFVLQLNRNEPFAPLFSVPRTVYDPFENDSVRSDAFSVPPLLLADHTTVPPELSSCSTVDVFPPQ
jgi:hypothetical protein